MDDGIFSLAFDLNAAAVGLVDWKDVLERIAHACGGWCLHVVDVETSGRMNLSLYGGVSDQVSIEFETANGGAASVNPRACAIHAAKPGSIVAEQDFISHQEMRKSAFYQDFSFRFDVPFSIMAKDTDRRSDTRLFAVLRSSGQGEAGHRERAAVGAIAPHMWSALRLRDQLRGQTIHSAMWSFEAIGEAAAVVDATGRIIESTSHCESIIASGLGFQRIANRIAAVSVRDARALREGIACVCGGPTGLPSVPMERILNLGTASMRWQVKISRLPPDVCGAGGAALALVMLEEAPPTPEHALTSSEIKVMELACSGLDIDHMAELRGVSRETIRSQLKSIYAKFGVTGRIELTAMTHAINRRRNGQS